jgi:hypothetical protein
VVVVVIKTQLFQQQVVRAVAVLMLQIEPQVVERQDKEMLAVLE